MLEPTAAASSRLEAAVSAASAQYSSVSKSAIPTQGALESISSVASVRLQEALSHGIFRTVLKCSRQHWVQQPTPAHQQYLNQAQRSYYEAVGYRTRAVFRLHYSCFRGCVR